MQLTININEAICNHLKNKNVDLTDYIEAKDFRMLKPEIRKVIISKLMILDNKDTNSNNRHQNNNETEDNNEEYTEVRI